MTGDRILKFQRHSETSRAAAAAFEDLALTARDRVYQYIIVSGPCSDEQIADGLDMNPSTVRPRRVELVEALLVENSGRQTRTRAGRRAVLWRVVTPEDEQLTLVPFTPPKQGEPQ